MLHSNHVRKTIAITALITATALPAAGYQTDGVINGSFSEASSGEWQTVRYLEEFDSVPDKNFRLEVTRKFESGRSFAHMEVIRNYDGELPTSRVKPRLFQRDITLPQTSSCIRSVLLEFDYRATSEISYYGLIAELSVRQVDMEPYETVSTAWLSQSEANQNSDDHGGWTTAQMILEIPEDLDLADSENLLFDVTFTVGACSTAPSCEPDFALVDLDEISIHANPSTGSDLSHGGMSGCGPDFGVVTWQRGVEILFEIDRTVLDRPVRPNYRQLIVGNYFCRPFGDVSCLASHDPLKVDYTPAKSKAYCLGDLNEDGTVNGADLTLLFSNWGSDPELGDLNCDGMADGQDLTLMFSNWGRCRLG